LQALGQHLLKGEVVALELRSEPYRVGHAGERDIDGLESARDMRLEQERERLRLALRALQRLLALTVKEGGSEDRDRKPYHGREGDQPALHACELTCESSRLSVVPGTTPTRAAPPGSEEGFRRAAARRRPAPRRSGRC